MDKCECGYADNADGLPYCGLCGGMIRPIEFPIVEIPNELVILCRDWHSGQTSAMYSVSSTSLIHNQSILLGLQSELRDTIRAVLEHSGPMTSDMRTDKATAERWLPILERWEATLPEEA